MPQRLLSEEHVRERPGLIHVYSQVADQERGGGAPQLLYPMATSNSEAMGTRVIIEAGLAWPACPW